MCAKWPREAAAAVHACQVAEGSGRRRAHTPSCRLEAAVAVFALTSYNFLLHLFTTPENKKEAGKVMGLSREVRSRRDGRNGSRSCVPIAKILPSGS